MKDEYTTYERRENIKLYLIKKRSTTTLQLLYMFGVSKRTILNDLVFLSSRIPIITKSGNGGGVFLDMKFENHKEYLSDNEQNLLERLSKVLSGNDKLIMEGIINKFSVHDGE